MAKIQLETYRNLALEGLTRRKVEVWLPPTYHEQQQKHFPVLYAMDGQNLFRSARLIGSGWRVAETITDLCTRRLIDPPIVVGISSTLNRLGDYMPEQPMSSPQAQEFLRDYLQAHDLDTSDWKGDLYLSYLVTVVKPFIERQYRVLKDPFSNVLMGSSMGGLISLYGVCEYSDEFAMAACLSTHWPITDVFMLDYLRTNLPDKGRAHFYFDHGDQDLDAQYAPWQARVDEIFEQAGYEQGKDYASWNFPGQGHHENYWAGRLHIPLTFLFGVQN